MRGVWLVFVTTWLVAIASADTSAPFDHATTGWPLEAKHARVACAACHAAAAGRDPNVDRASYAGASRACESCHANDSHHGERFKAFGSPPACATCHAVGSSKFTPAAFNHGARTRFVLTGMHAEVPCRACHRGASAAEFEDLAKLVPASGAVDCRGCHAHANVHDGKWRSEQCLSCHTSNWFRPPGPGLAMFHGPRSTFPLVKEHRAVPCADCHATRDARNRIRFDGLSTACGSCHDDSLHHGTLGSACDTCHPPGSWDAAAFDHDATRLPLGGAHAGVACTACHADRDFAAARGRAACASCHRDDDAHRGRLGAACDRCHRATGELAFDHATMAAFRLDGKHLAVPCADCHPSITFKPRPTTCFGCHPEPAIHKGKFGTACAKCHPTRTFANFRTR
jgi:hypothetical protein